MKLVEKISSFREEHPVVVTCVLLLVECLCAAFLLPPPIHPHSLHWWGNAQSVGVVGSAPFAVPYTPFALAAFVFLRRLGSRWRTPSAPLGGLLGALVGLAVVFAIPDSGAPPPWFVALGICTGTLVNALACSFDLLTEKRTRALGATSAALLVLLCRSEAAREGMALLAGQPRLSVITAALLAVVCTLVVALAFAARSSQREAVLHLFEAAALACFCLALYAFTAFIVVDPRHSLLHGASIVWFLPGAFVVTSALVVLARSSERARSAVRRAGAIIGLCAAACITLACVDRAAYGRAPRDRSPLAAIPIGSGDTPVISLMVKSRGRIADGTKCAEDVLENRLSTWRVLHPNDTLENEVGLFVEVSAQERDFELCLGALASWQVEHVVLLGQDDAPLPRWAPLHAYARAKAPVVPVARFALRELRRPQGAAYVSLRELLARVGAARHEDPQPRERD